MIEWSKGDDECHHAFAEYDPRKQQSPLRIRHGRGNPQVTRFSIEKKGLGGSCQHKEAASYDAQGFRNSRHDHPSGKSASFSVPFKTVEFRKEFTSSGVVSPVSIARILPSRTIVIVGVACGPQSSHTFI